MNLKRTIIELVVEIEHKGKVQTFQMEKFDFVIGRSKDADVQVGIKESSRRHLRVEEEDGQIFVTDLGSKNGTKISGQIIERGQKVLYPIGAELKFGNAKEVLRIRARVEAAEEDSIDVAENLDQTAVLAEPILDKTEVLSDKDLSESLRRSHVDIEVHEDDELEPTSKASLTTVDFGSLDGALKAEKEESEKQARKSSQKEVEQIRLDRAQDVETMDSLSEPPRLSENQASPPMPPRPEKPVKSQQREISRETRPDQSRQVLPQNHGPSIPKNPQSQNIPHPRSQKKYGFSKLRDLKGLVSEITQEASQAIDQNFFNVPPDKRATKKAEKILIETKRAAEELQEQAYLKHDRIIKKATVKATELLAEAESDRAQYLEEAKVRIEKLNREQIKANEAALDKVIDEANAKASELVANAEQVASRLKEEADKRVELSQHQAKTLVSDAKSKSESLLNEMALNKEKAEQELSELEGRQDELQKLILKLGDQVEDWERKAVEAESLNEKAIEEIETERQELEAKRSRLQAEKALLGKEIEEFKATKEEEFAAVESRHHQALAELQVRLEDEKAELEAKLSSEQAEIRLEFENKSKELETQLTEFDEILNSKEGQLQAELALKEREQAESLKELSNDYNGQVAELKLSLDKEQKSYAVKIEKLSREYGQKEADLKQRFEASQEEFEKAMLLKSQELESEYEQKHSEMEEQFQEHKARIDRQAEAVQSEFNQLKSEIEGEKENLRNRIENLTLKKKELFATVQGLESKKSELLEVIESHEQTWLQGTADYEKALEGRKRSEREMLEIEEQRDLTLEEIERLRDHKSSIQMAIDNLDNTKAQELKNISIMKEEALTQIGVERARSEAELAKKRLEMEQHLESLTTKALDESHLLVAEAERVKTEASEAAERIIQHAEEERAELQRQAETWKDQQKAELQKQKQDWNDQFEVEKAKKINEREVWLKEFKELRTGQELEHEQRLEELERQYSERLSTLESEFSDLSQNQKNRLQLEMADTRVKRMAEIEFEVQNYKDLFEKQKEERATSLARSLDAKLITELKPILGDRANGKLIDQISGELQKVVMESLIPDGDFQDEEFREIIGVHAKEMVSSSLFWRKSFAVVAGLLLLIGLPSMWSAFKTQTREMASQQKSDNAAKFIESVREKRKSQPKFDPVMKPVYFDSYTDRILYTKDYASNELEPTFRELWILSLNEFFVEKLGLSENVIVPFIAMESNLIRELSELRKKVRPEPERFEQSVEPMRKAEKEFIEQIQKTLKRKSNYKKFIKFKKEYFSKKYVPKSVK